MHKDVGGDVPWACPAVQGVSGAHLIHSILREVELSQAGGVAERHIRPPAEEHKGTGSLGQWAQKHLDVGFLLGVGIGG